MFNENSMYGTQVAKRDEKNRVFIPSFTGAQKSDELVIVQYQNFYKILRKDVFDQMISDIESEIAQLVRSGSISKVDILEKYKNKMLMGVVREATVDGQKRINIGTLFSNDQTVTLVGAKDAVYLMNESVYADYIKEVNESLSNLTEDNSNTLKLG